MGCSGSKEPPHPDFGSEEGNAIRDDAVRIFKLADADSSGFLDITELKSTMRNPQHSDMVMSNLDTDLDGKVDLNEWLTSIKGTFDKNATAAKAALKMHEKAINMWKQKAAEEAAAQAEAAAGAAGAAEGAASHSLSIDISTNTDVAPAQQWAVTGDFASFFEREFPEAKNTREGGNEQGATRTTNAMGEPLTEVLKKIDGLGRTLTYEMTLIPSAMPLASYSCSVLVTEAEGGSTVTTKAEMDCTPRARRDRTCPNTHVGVLHVRHAPCTRHRGRRSGRRDAQGGRASLLDIRRDEGFLRGRVQGLGRVSRQTGQGERLIEGTGGSVARRWCEAVRRVTNFQTD